MLPCRCTLHLSRCLPLSTGRRRRHRSSAHSSLALVENPSLTQALQSIADARGKSPKVRMFQLSEICEPLFWKASALEPLPPKATSDSRHTVPQKYSRSSAWINATDAGAACERKSGICCNGLGNVAPDMSHRCRCSSCATLQMRAVGDCQIVGRKGANNIQQDLPAGEQEKNI